MTIDQILVSGTGGFSSQIDTVSSLWKYSGNYEVHASYGSGYATVLTEVERFYFYAPINNPPPTPTTPTPTTPTPTTPTPTTPVKPILILNQIPSAVRAGETVTFTGKLTSQGLSLIHI